MVRILSSDRVTRFHSYQTSEKSLTEINSQPAKFRGRVRDGQDEAD